ncbi:MAG TPA: hypothetical protein VFR85_19250 [Anaeromyxobacteraceae bacterium]|nr:hypothetical protein [Anaeromyxobacteraceae bacterium]
MRSASAYDPVAARQGVLIEERQVRALAAPEPFLVPELEDADVVPVEPPSPRPPEPGGRSEPGPGRAPRPRTGSRPRRAAAVLVLLVAAGGTAWLLVHHDSVRLPAAIAGFLDRLRGGSPGPGAPEVAAALQANARRFDACVQAAERGPRRLRLAGRSVVLFVTVNASGRVTAPRLEEAELDRSPPGACLKAAARRMNFSPHPGEPIQVRIPLELGSRG